MTNFAKILFVLALVLFLIYFSECKVRKEHIEANGLHSNQKPSDIKRELGENVKKTNNALRKNLKKQWKKRHSRKEVNPYK